MGRTSDAKSRILASALRLIHEKGYANVGVDEIMQAANVGKSSFYHFFKSKEILGEAVMDEYSKKMCREVLDKAFAQAVPPLKRPQALIRTLSDEKLPIKGCLGGNSAAENSTISESIRLKTESFLELLRTKFEEAYTEAINEMQLLPDAPVEKLACASVAYVQGMILVCKVKQSWQPLQDLGPLLDNLWRSYAVSQI